MVFPGLRVLVVEDDQLIQDFLGRLLGFWGCKVEFAANGEEGVEKYRKSRPELVLMDLEMPLLNGFEASQCIMKLDSQASILLITGAADTTLARKALEKRVVRVVLPKPFRLGQLRMAVEEALREPKLPSVASSRNRAIG